MIYYKIQKIFYLVCLFNFCLYASDKEEKDFFNFCQQATRVINISNTYCNEEWLKIKKSPALTKDNKIKAVAQVLFKIKKSSNDLNVYGHLLNYFPMLMTHYSNKTAQLLNTFVD